jgi:DNA-binding NtrC family response regulator
VSGSVLIVDDEPGIGKVLRTPLESDGLAVEVFQDPERALARLKERHFDVVLTDLKMPTIDGLELLRRTKVIRPESEVVLMTAYATVAAATEALKRGAVDFITKPFSLEEELMPLIRGILASPAADEGERAPSTGRERSPAPAGKAFEGIVGRGPAMQAVLDRVRKLARSSAPVLLQGESGTGKEVIANALHQASARGDREMVKINCAALPETLLESELFGYTKGSFSGAAADREGLFQVAHGSTLFLDEIGEISPTFQPKLLRVLQDGEFHRIGDSRHTMRVDVRVIAASNRDLEEAVRMGTFRRDLYYRLNVVPLLLPPLRQRREDLPDLIAHFTRQLAGDPEVSFSPEALAALKDYDWPGNVRELANAIHHGLVMGDAPEIRLEDLPIAVQDFQRSHTEYEHPSEAHPTTLEAIEIRSILQAMKKTGHNRTEAAQVLGVTRRTLSYRIRKYGLEEEFESRPSGTVSSTEAGSRPRMARVDPGRGAKASA